MRSRLALLVLVLLLAAAPAAQAATALTAPTKVVKVGKQRVGYRSFGHGRPLVMVMGLGGTMGSWDPTFLDALAAGGHRIVLLDNEGVGKTTALPGRLTIRRMADTTAGLIERLRLRRPDVAGWSMGGMIAQSLAVRHAKVVRRLVLMATAPGDGKGTAPTAAALQTLTNPSSPPAAQSLEQLQASSIWLTAQDPDGKRVAKLKLPTLVGGGQDDQLLPVANQEHLAQIIKGARLVTYPDAAHGFLFQDASDFVPKLLTFLE
jgi:pimeloyl-ACP methyl ester carboxylesterase